MHFLVIHRCEDGVHMGYMSEAQVKERVTEEWCSGYRFLFEAEISSIYLDAFPERTVLIFKGKVCQPVSVSRVTEWAIL